MDEDASEAIQQAWQQTIKARALCPYTTDNAVSQSGYLSPPWYLSRGAIYFVNLATPLTIEDIRELRQIGGFINRSFIINMVAILEERGVIPYQSDPDTSLEGGKHAQLAKWLRNRFAHGEWEYDKSKRTHRETRDLLEELLPEATAGNTGFIISIDGVLEPLKDGVLAYIKAVGH